ncbi:MAG: acyltransferase [Sphingobium sp.]
MSTNTARRSDAIAIARVVCILGVIYVHAWTGLNGAMLEQLRGTPQENLRWVLMESFGRSAVPLLGLISGWLVGSSPRTRDWGRHVSRKAQTILLPMILWNGLAIVLVSGTAHVGTLAAPHVQSWSWLAQELFILTRNPDINVQMPFLRDLFLCMIVAPLMVRLPNGLLILIAAAAALCHIAGIGPPVLMRTSILFFFTVGMLAQRLGWADRTAAMPLFAAALPFLLLMPVQLFQNGWAHGGMTMPALRALDLAVRVAAALFFWRLSWALAGSSVRGALLRIEPYAFFLFCAHLIIIWLGGPAIGAVVGRLGAPLYPLYLIIQPVLVLMLVLVVGTALKQVAPRTAGLLSGGRLRRA